MPRGGSKKGERRGGRKKGTPNKVTTDMKAVMQAVHDGIGGVERMIKWADEEPGEFYRLWVKMLPTELKNADGKPFQMVLVEEIVGADDSQDGPTVPPAG